MKTWTFIFVVLACGAEAQQLGDYTFYESGGNLSSKIKNGDGLTSRLLIGVTLVIDKETK